MTPPLELAVVIPTFNERENVEPILELLCQALTGIEYEVIFVDDDSSDGTAAIVRAIALSNPQVRVLQRVGRRGLSSACLEGMMATPAPFIAVMDADLQHDERILPRMLQTLKSNNLDFGATADWTFTDAGEPGTSDTATYLIRDVHGNVVLTVAVQVLDKGNQQAHKDNK